MDGHRRWSRAGFLPEWALAGARSRVPATLAVPGVSWGLLLLLLLGGGPAAAQGSFDVLVTTSGTRLVAGFNSHARGPTSGPVHATSGLKLYRVDFGDLPGGPRATDDPGFQALPGTLAPSRLLYVRGEGSLQYWPGPGTAWGAPPAGERVRLYGAVPTDVALANLYCLVGDPVLCNPALAAQYAFYEQGTSFSAGGVSGPNPTIIDEVTAQGGFHAHLDWFLEGESGALPSIGAYMVTMRLSSNGGPYEDSRPFHVLFNHGLSAGAFAGAVPMRTVGFPITDPAVVPLPPGALLGLSGLLFLLAVQRAGRVRVPTVGSTGPVPG